MNILASSMLLFALALGSGPQPADTLPPPPAGKTWHLAWHDEFDGNKLDTTRWQIPPDGKRKGGFWKKSAVSLDARGHLVLRTLQDQDGYVSGAVNTRGKYEPTFGYFVCRAKMQKQPGHWTAFWLTGKGVASVGNHGRDGTEIDIFEKPTLDDRVQHTLHWDGYGKDHQSASHRSRIAGVMEGFHTFGLLWLPDQYIIYVDGQPVWQTRAGGVCQAPLYLLLSSEVGTWAGDIKQAKLPDNFVIDYVRVYQIRPTQR